MTRSHPNSRVRRFLSTVPVTPASLRAALWLDDSDARRGYASSSYFPMVSWSQEGEDVLLAQELPPIGRYVDVGAHDPYRFSNTKLLYDKGWRGINIDLTHDFLEHFAKHRPEDVNVRALVGRPGTRTLYRFEEEALNTLSVERAEELQGDGWLLRSEETVDVRPLDDILTDSGIPRRIDLLAVDAEGSDLEVLETLNWTRWDVDRVLVEIGVPAYQVPMNPIAAFLDEAGYLLSRVWGRSCLFERNPDLISEP